jgi:hypothetical protein
MKEKVLMRHLGRAILAAVWLAGLAGCEPGLYFPGPSAVGWTGSPQGSGAGGAGEALRSYDVGGVGHPDFFLYADASGRVNRLGYDTEGKGRAGTVVDLDAIPMSRCRHLVIILDGFGYEVVRKFYDEGGLRMFYPPSRVIAPYPTLTDTGLEDVFGYVPCVGYEAAYFDRRANQMEGGMGRYLSGASMPYDRLLQYRANVAWDGISYVKPWFVFDRELNHAAAHFNENLTQEFIAYFVSSAGVSTVEGAEGQRRCLASVEELINQVLWQTHGMVKITMFADHGHSYTMSKQIPFDEYLKGKGWRTGESLTAARDVVWVRFGLLTYAAFNTHEPAALAADLTGCAGVDLASYAEGEAVVVRSADGGKATVRRKGERYLYETAAGDPLKFKEVLAKLMPDGEGYYAADEMFRVSADAEYPAALERIWRGHFGLVENPADVLVSLKDGYYSGAGGFVGMVQVASTHGSLNRRNTTTFVMSTAGPLPELMRSAEVRVHLGELVGGKWPMGR